MTSPDQPLNKKRKRVRPRKKSLPGCDIDEIQGPPGRGVDEKHMYTTPPSILLKRRSASKTQSTKATGAISTTPPSILSKLRSASKTQSTKATGAISTTPPSILSKLSTAKEVRRGCEEYRQHMKKMIKSDDRPVLTLELQQKSSSEKLEPKKKNGDDHDQIKGTCSSYTAGDAKPQSLRIALSVTRVAMAAFQKALFDCFETRENKLWDEPSPQIFFDRPSHSTHYFKSVVNRVFFEGFENESFNTMSGVSRFLDPCHRQEMFYKYYLSERERSKSSDCQSSQDPQFEEFCEMKLYSFLWTLLPHEDQCNTKRVKVSYLEGQLFGGPELVSTFRTAAKTVWLLHKLAFSFEPPATIFRVEGAEVDTKYMKSTIVKVEDNERFVSKVGFMIDPGLRLNGEIIICDVMFTSLHPACTSTTAGNSPN
ncbi:unnamed protein product [Calypogeia fissa]